MGIHLFFITEGTTYFVTSDRASNFDEIKKLISPLTYHFGSSMSFHNCALYLGEKNCDKLASNYHSETYYSYNYGCSWVFTGTFLSDISLFSILAFALFYVC